MVRSGLHIEVDNDDAEVEVLSVSRRTVVQVRFGSDGGDAGAQESNIRILGIAIGLDRCLYNWLIAAGRAA